MSTRFLRLALPFLIAGCFWTGAAFAQDLPDTPLYFTIRLFQAAAPKGTDISDQLFRLRSAGQWDNEVWLTQVGKAYPGAELSLLQTFQFRSFQRPTPYVVTLGDPAKPHMEVHVRTALGIGPNDEQVIDALVEANYYASAKTNTSMPSGLCYQSFTTKPETTFFFTSRSLALNPSNYAEYTRGGTKSSTYDKVDHYLIVSLTVEAADAPKLTFDFRTSPAFQAQATSQPQPEWPASVVSNGLSGRVMVKVEVDAEGNVARAVVWRSTLPEANLQVLEAARKWKFPAAALASVEKPATAILSFDYKAPAPTPAPEKPATPR